MLIGLMAAQDTISKSWAKKVEKLFRKRYPDQGLTFDLTPPKPEILIAIGDDRFLLDSFRNIGFDTAILGLGQGFLSEIIPEHIENFIGRLMKGEYWIEERLRMEVKIGEKILPPILNEVALTTGRGGGFLRYTLMIDGERVWHDSGDGVVVCTPTGSTGYALSAGGPIVMENAEAIVIVPVCSANENHPLVVPHDTEIRLTDIQSRLAKDVVLDGRDRIRLKKSGFSVKESSNPARFVRFDKAEYLRIFGKFRTRHPGFEMLVSAPPSAKFLFRLLEDMGPLTEKQLIQESGLPERTVRSALTELIKRKLVQKIPSLRDTRESSFAIIP